MNPRCRIIYGLLFAIAAPCAALAYEPIERLPATDATFRTAQLPSEPRVGAPPPPAGIWPGNETHVDLLPDPPPLLGPFGAVPTYPEGFTDPSVMRGPPGPPPRHVWP